MHWIQEEKPIQYHVIQWRNSEFHNHDTGIKRKLFGGVSFDGGGAAGGSKGTAAPQTGVQPAQPSFSSASDIGLFGNGLGIGPNGLEGMEAGAKGQGAEKGRDTLSIHNTENAKSTEGMEITAAQQMAAANAGFDANFIANNNVSKITDVMETVEPKIRRGISFLHSFKKLQNTIQTFLKNAEQKAGGEKRQNREKKKIRGTRTITKEEFYEMQADAGYLLDSYNKNGERSTLGK